MTGRRASDWLRALPASEQEIEQDDGADRRSEDRRCADRRAPKRPLNPQFAATLLSQMLPAERAPGAYPARKNPRAGIVVDVQA
jgi:hypothetical protein